MGAGPAGATCLHAVPCLTMLPKYMLPLAAVLLAACQPADAPTESVPLPKVSQVLLVSVDGLRGDALAAMPNLRALEPRAAWTDALETVVPALTGPAHLALFTGADVTKFGVTTNGLNASVGAALLLNGATSMFRWTADRDAGTAAVVSAAFIPPADLASARALLGLDTILTVTADPDSLMDRAVALLNAPGAPAVVFVHLPSVDEAGHAHGWLDAGGALGAAYRAEVGRVDAALGRAWSAIAARVDAGDVAFVVTADHGGGQGEACVAGIAATHEHCTAHAGDRQVPLVMVGTPVAARRLPAGSRLTQVAPTIAGMLKAAPSPSWRADDAF